MLFLLSPADGRAIATGGAFAGPTLASGSSGFWGGAALGRATEPLSLHVELTGIAGVASFERDGTDPNTGAAYERTSMTLLAPDLSLAVSGRTPWSWLRIAGAAFSPYAIGSTWPKDGSARYFVTDSLVATYGGVVGVAVTPAPWMAFALMGGPAYTLLSMNSAYDFGSFANAKSGSDLFAPEDPFLEGELAIRAAGWSPLFVAGATVRATRAVSIALGAMLPQTVLLRGGLDVSAPASFDEALPGVRLAPTGRFELRYPMPLRFHAETELALGAVRVAALGTYTPSYGRKVIYPTITEAEPDFLEGRQYSVKDVQDDLSGGLRVIAPYSEAVDFAARLDLDPRSIPDEALTPTNFDLSSLEVVLGGRWRATDRVALDVSLAYRHFKDTRVRSSLFNPRAPPDSGLNTPSGNGRYDAWAMRLVAGLTLIGRDESSDVTW